MHGHGRKFWCEVSLFTQIFKLVLYTIFVKFFNEFEKVYNFENSFWIEKEIREITTQLFSGKMKMS